MLQQKRNILLFCILILSFILRTIYLDSKSLWLDEAINVMLAEQSIFTWNTDLPPLYFALLHLTLAVGKSEAVVRFPSVIFGVLSVYVIYKIGIILYGEKEALVSAFLLSISSVAIFFSQDARYYSLFIPLSLLSVYFFLRMEEKPTNLNKALFLVSIVLTFYTHYFTVLLLIVFIIFKIWKYKKDKNLKSIKSFLLLMGIFCLLIAPILPIFISQTLGKAGTSYINFKYQAQFSLDFLKNIFTYLIVGEFYNRESILLYIIIGLSLYGLLSYSKYFESTLFLIIWLFIPIISAAVLTNFISNLHIRYIIFTLPALLLLSSRGIVTITNVSLWKKRKTETTKPKTKKKFNAIKSDKAGNSLYIALTLIIVVLSNYPILKDYYASKSYDWRSSVEFIEQNAEEGSNIVLVPGFNVVPFNYYYKAKAKINVFEYTNFDEFVKLTFQNITYIVITTDAYALKPDEHDMLYSWLADNAINKAEFGAVYIGYHNSRDYDWRGTVEFIEKNAEDGSNIILVPGFNVVPFNYYYKAKAKINVFEYTNFDEFVKLTFQNNTYIVMTTDIYALKPDELDKFQVWLVNNAVRKAEFDGVYIAKKAG